MLVELQNISKCLGNFRLEDISMQLPEGYILGLIGPNGAGKTCYKMSRGERMKF